MKKLVLALTFGVALSWAAGTLATAQVITSVNFQAGDTVALAPTDVTGAVPAANFNNVNGASGTGIALHDSTGAATGLTLTFQSSGEVGGSGNNSTPQEILFANGIEMSFAPAPQVTISGLSEFSSYNLYVYYDGGQFGTTPERTGSISASGSPTTFFVEPIKTAATAFTQSNSTTSGVFAPGNYVEFTGLTASSEDITASFGNIVDVAGFQIEGILAVPEPSTWALLLGGMLSLIRVQQLRRRNAQI